MKIHNKRLDKFRCLGIYLVVDEKYCTRNAPSLSVLFQSVSSGTIILQ